MKSLGKLPIFGLHPSDGKEKREHPRLNDLAQASQDMQDMRNCYDGLLSAAAATTNSAYEFSESLRDMGTCLLEKTALNDDESCKALSMLGNVQLGLQKLLDSYRSHVILTITTPSESLLNELRTVEEMKRQCDEKRSLYEYMVAQQREKRKSKSAKVENFTSQELQAARDAYEEEATLCVFRLKSLKQGQYRSLLTQAVRHHASQLKFFRKGLQSLEAIEPHIRVIAEKQHIDYQVSGLDDGEDGGDEGVNSLETNDDGELSFDYRINKKGLDTVSTSRNSMEVDQVGLPRPQVSTVENAEAILNKSLGEQIFNRETRISSYSAPIFAEKKFDPAERIREMQQSSARKFHSYVLPTPIDAKSSTSTRTNSSVLQLRPTSHTGDAQSLWHSSPLEPEKHEKGFTDDNLSVPTISKAHLKLKDGSSNNLSVQLPPSLAQGLSRDAHSAYDAKKVKRQAFSGPLTSKPLSTKPALSASGPITPTELPQLVSGLLSRVPTAQPSSSSPKVSPSASPPIASSPRISELHELPRPPGGLASKPVSSSTGHSAPLVFRNQELSPRNKSPDGAFSTASPLPTPPLTIPRCYSIPSSNQRATAIPVARLFECPELPEKTEKVTSPPLMPMSLSNNKLLSTASEVASYSGQIKGES
ncbi:uncharacterized protein At2g33490-like isoform X1 [Actinidia eriantha]|uniref:uncharacterized protein At2g33490-like isoform X1 n=1 Tax=Actinidia eriantha TaxID=165200 RepID=UPI002586CFBE|nr:uncharacterized protein At2g33490-like isoform X1 [Actinidia eriantha]